MLRYIILLLFLFIVIVASMRKNVAVNKWKTHYLRVSKSHDNTDHDLQILDTFCFKTECRCEQTKADCSQNYGKLTFVPQLPDTIQFLNFSYNNLTAISRADFFANVTELQFLDLGDNNLMSVHPNAFRVFSNLSSVFLDYNFNLTMEAMEPILSTTTLKRLDLRHGGLLKIPEDIFRRFPLPSLKTLYLHENKLNRLNFTTLVPLKKLSNLGLANNHISEVDSDMMVGLERLNLEHNPLFQLPQTCRNGSSLFPCLTHLFLANSLISAITGEVCLPHLQVLELTWSLISHFVSDMFGVHRFPSLAILQLQSLSSQRKVVEAHAFRNPKLKWLNLMYSDLSFNSDLVSADCFSGCSNLLHLQVSHTFFVSIANEKWQRLFKPLRKLQTLYLGSISLKNVSSDAFANLLSLQQLYLYGNALSDLPDGIFDHLNLTHLGLENNKISVIKESTFSVRTRNRLISLDLSDNPFFCSCDLLWFQEWFLSNPALFSDSWGDYRCNNLPGTRLGSFVMNPQACLLSHDVCIFIAISISMMMAVTMLVSVIFHYRWHLRLILYEAFRGRDVEVRRRRFREQHFDYDVFVSYAISDCDWVLWRLRPLLEDVWGLRLCLHQRDFIPGKNIADNITDCVVSSKKVLMVFSANYAVSPWCQFELNFCLRHVMDFDDALVVVRLYDMASRDLTSTMTAVHKTTTYIQWGAGAEVEASFWGRLRIAFEEVLPAGG